MKAMPVPAGSAFDALRDEAIMADRLDTDSARLREEFLSMPALCLTVEQVARLLNVPIAGASHLLAALEHDGFLVRAPSGRYRLAEPLGRALSEDPS
jgi:predicted transcriptional regulator of viral defense system